jgi:hypothetical protein
MTRLRMTKPPLASTRARSQASVALWSWLSRTATPAWHSTARASPTLAV